MSRRGKLLRDAYREFKVTRQVSTGNGESYLAASDRPPGYFVAVELGFGVHERPCTDCHKPCTLDYTLQSLDEINQRNLTEIELRDPGDLPHRISSAQGLVADHFRLGVGAQRSKPAKVRRVPASEVCRKIRAQGRRAGVRVVRGQYVSDDKRPRTWLPFDPNHLGRRETRAEELIERHKELTRDPASR